MEKKIKRGTRVYAELDRIRREHGGILVPEDVVEAARSPKSPLHSQFEWDNTKAAREYRLEQARHLIRVAVTVLESTHKEVRAFVSLRQDRAKTGGGYRAMVDVLSNDQLRVQLLEEARADMMLFKMKYASLEELAVVFAAMNKALAARTAAGMLGKLKRALASV